jgi:hypothetical protein
MAVDMTVRACESHAANLQYCEDRIGAAMLGAASSAQAQRFVAGSIF